MSLGSPLLCPISQCKTTLDFSPRLHWPDGLPAVAVNRWVLAGFDQTLVFNHEIVSENAPAITQLFCSLYSELSFAELARLLVIAKDLSWFPIDRIFANYHVSFNESSVRLANILATLPRGFQDWCAEKKLVPGDLLPLLSAKGLNLNPIYHELVRLNVSKMLGVQVIELAVDLLGMHHPSTSLLPEDFSADDWLTKLKELRFPATLDRDRKSAENMQRLPWPGSGQVRWVRKGDRAGIELKLFVGKPSDLQKYIDSLNDIQKILEADSDSPWFPH